MLCLSARIISSDMAVGSKLMWLKVVLRVPDSWLSSSACGIYRVKEHVEKVDKKEILFFPYQKIHSNQ